LADDGRARGSGDMNEPAAERVAILIVGGGIGGLAAALAIARTGRPVHVLESAPAFGELGAGIQLGANATGALERLGVMREVERHSFFPARLVLMDALSGEPLTSLDTGEPYRARYGHPYVVLHRHDLLNVLLAACMDDERIRLETGKRVIEVEDLSPGALVRCADGSTYTCDALIGADGLRSVVRELVSDDEPTCSEYVAYRGTIPMREVSRNAGLDDVLMWVGPELHLVQYPVRRGELYNQVGVFRSHAYTPDGDDWGTPEELDETFSVTSAIVREAVSRLGRQRRWPMFDRAPIDNWTRNTITLLGDAAHPMLQYLAQGGCQALEDAVVLGAALDRADGDAAAAFVDYQSERLSRTARVQTSARIWGDICHVDGVGALLRHELLALREPTDYEVVDWLYAGGPVEPRRATAAAAQSRRP
jgi:3-hydroxybenzoate 6-monooxygenase